MIFQKFSPFNYKAQPYPIHTAKFPPSAYQPVPNLPEHRLLKNIGRDSLTNHHNRNKQARGWRRL